MELALSPTPWGLQDDSTQVENLSDQGKIYSVPGMCSPHIIVPVEVHPRFSKGNKLLPRTSFPFRWDGKIYCCYQLPTNPKPTGETHDFSTRVSGRNATFEIKQTGIVGRPSKDHESALGKSVGSFIDWQIHCFKELSGADRLLEEFEEKTKRIVRRNWRTVRKIWIENKSEKAIMALIVKLARNKELLRVLDSIANSPRYILIRYRTNTRLDRIQEIDSACIRDIARRPGRSIYEKAGPRQELLAIQRVESKDTLENRVLLWVFGTMLERAWHYIATNEHHRKTGSSRVEDVVKCSRKCEKWRIAEKLLDVSTNHLHHPVQPNYTLQMDGRYKNVYRTYKKLLREQIIIDDAWEWQRNLWADSARQLLFCALTESYFELSSSTPYYRSEGEYGFWTEQPVSPGPFLTSGGKCFVIDSRDVADDMDAWVNKPPFPFSPYLGTVGCDQVLFWPETNSIILVWFVYWTGKQDLVVHLINSAGEALRNFSRDLNKYTQIGYNCFGLSIMTDNQNGLSEQGVEIDAWPSEGQLELVGLRVPFSIEKARQQEFEKLINDLKTGIQLVTDEVV